MTRYSFAAIVLALSSVAIPLRAANRPHAGTDSQSLVVWTTDDLERLHVPGFIGMVGRVNEEMPKSPSGPAPYVETRDPAWYAEQAAKLRDQLERKKAQLGGYRQGIEDGESLKTMTDGIDFDESNLGVTPEAGIAILQLRVSETRTEHDTFRRLGPPQ